MRKTSGGRLTIALGLFTALAPAVAQTLPAPDSVEIFGKGQTRQVHNITRKDLAEALPGTSPLKTLQKLPGVSFQASDAFGAYEWLFPGPDGLHARRTPAGQYELREQ